MNSSFHYVAAIVLTLTSAVSFAHDYQAGALKIAHPWARATPAGAKVGGGYLAIENTGTTADRLVSASADFAARVEMHEMAVANGIMTMRPLENGVPIAPGAKLEFKPGGLHVMFVDLQRPLTAGDFAKATLVFEKAGPVEVSFKVEPVGARSSAETGHKH